MSLINFAIAPIILPLSCWRSHYRKHNYSAITRSCRLGEVAQVWGDGEMGR
ncbi:MAG: hypothetical protein F6J92_33235 [Symploca sp. SIO1A3]|nr:hypothetical protein [Symploca sp. SIO1A3]